MPEENHSCVDYHKNPSLNGRKGQPGFVHRVLVADDDEIIQRLVHAILAEGGFSVEFCGDGLTALRRAAEGNWSLLALDLYMPHRTGLEVIRELRAAGERLPIVLMSGNLNEAVIEECGVLGAVECVPKPFDAKMLMEAVARLVVCPRQHGIAGS